LKFVVPFPVIPIVIINKLENVRILQNEGAFDLCILIEYSIIELLLNVIIVSL